MSEGTIKLIVQIIFITAGFALAGGLISYCDHDDSQWDDFVYGMIVFPIGLWLAVGFIFLVFQLVRLGVWAFS